MKTITFLGFLAMCPTTALAQSEPFRVLGCRINTSCSGEGDCHSVGEEVSFRITGKEVERHGEGTYELSYRGIIVEAQNVTMLGPLIWSEGQDDIQILSYSWDEKYGLGADEGHLVWTATRFSDPMSGTVKFLFCGEG